MTEGPPQEQDSALGESASPDHQGAGSAVSTSSGGGVVKKQLYVHFAAFAAGFIIAAGVAQASGIPVAWATPMYFIVGWPVMCLVIYLMARAYPERAWRWTLSMMLGQVFSSLFFGGGAFLPVAMVYVTLLSVPQFYAGTLGSRAGLRRLPQDQSATTNNIDDISAGAVVKDSTHSDSQDNK
ncbi:MAG: hypothetical protein Q8K97_15895 [Pseudohongiella sp.]|nr:hypothetical protein [Pseudohongiella sp.]